MVFPIQMCVCFANQLLLFTPRVMLLDCQTAVRAVCAPVSQRFLPLSDYGPETLSLCFFSPLSDTVGCCVAQLITVWDAVWLNP